MSGRIFGTDGVRGPWGGPHVNPAFFARLGAAAGGWAGGSGAVSIGWDTRFSGPELAVALASGLRSAGLAPHALGVVPTPAVARAVRVRRAVLGAVVTASHNPADDNGVKFFDAEGRKLADGDEARIEALLPAEPPALLPAAEVFAGGAASNATVDYAAAAARLLPPGSLQGWRIVLDAANGAASVTSPTALRALGAEVVALGCAPDGRNINAGAGSEHPQALAERVRSSGARLGLAHDGDGDRCVLCDERGDILDGDEILVLLAVHALARGSLAERTLVVTVQSNLGVDAALAAAGGRVLRTAVGDRHVAEGMRAVGASLGGESSGHIIFSDHASTGDGLIAALKTIEVMQATGRPLSELRRALRKFPQASAAVPVREKRPFEAMPALSRTMRALEAELGSQGRILVRYSGTEPKLRLLVEGPTEEVVRAGLARLKAAAESA